MSLLLFLILVATLVGLLILRSIQSWQKQRQIERSPVIEVSAQVITTYKAHGTSSRVHQPLVNYVVFELQTGERKTFEVEYRPLAEGMQGRLTYQGSRFLNFQY